jgi:DNA-binding NarL/FixJ family response regulator
MNMKPLIDVGIVDDHELYKKGLRLALSFYENVNVLFEATDGLDLLNQLNVSTPNVILLDLQMSGMDGITVLPRIKKAFPQIKVIILSIYDDFMTVDKLKGLGADSFLSKSSDIRKMYEEISQVVTNRQPA